MNKVIGFPIFCLTLFVKLFLLIPQWLMVLCTVHISQITMLLCKVHISNPWRKVVYHLELSSVHSAASPCHACYLMLCNKENHRGIGKIVEDTCCHVSLLSLSILGISGRDSCKGGRFVTARVWYCKI